VTAAPEAIGVLGGSGIYDLAALEDVEEVSVDTPFGAPSDALITGRLGDRKLVFLPRHGRGHRILPHEINYRANIHALKQLGCGWVISLSAVGSMKESIAPGDLVIVDQFIDLTKKRISTFFGDGVAAHVMFGDPVSKQLADVLHRAASTEVEAGGGTETVHSGGTYVVMEGPQFSTLAESRLYRSWGVDVIGMTNMPEAKLAREAEMSYATVAMATDYDCWHEGHDDVSVEAVIAILKHNAELARKVLVRAVELLPAERTCPAKSALADAIITQPDQIPDAARRRLDLLIGKYLT